MIHSALLKVTPFSLDVADHRISSNFPAEYVERAQEESSVLWRALASHQGPQCAQTRAAFLAARSCNTIIFSHETLDGKLSPSLRDVVQTTLMRASLLLLAAAIETPRNAPRTHRGADGKWRNDHMVREAEAFQVFSWCRERARASNLPLPVGVSGSDYAQETASNTRQFLSEVDAGLFSKDFPVFGLDELFSDVATLTTRLLDDCSRFDKNDPPSTARTGIFRREGESRSLRHDTVEMNWRRAFAFDASLAFRRLVRIERALNQMRHSGDKR